MSEIKFYIPKDETIPTDLRLYVGDIYMCIMSALKVDSDSTFRLMMRIRQLMLQKRLRTK